MNDYTRGAIWAFSVTVLTGGVLATGVQIGKKLGAKEAAHKYLFELYKSTAHSELKRAVEFVEKVDQEAIQYSILDTQKIKDIFGVKSPSKLLQDFDLEPKSNPEQQIIDNFTETPISKQEKASRVLSKLHREIANTGSVSVADYRIFIDPIGGAPLHEEEYVGWTDLGDVAIHSDDQEWFVLNLPRPVVLSGVSSSQE